MPKATDARSTGATFMSSAERATPPALPSSPHRRSLLAGAAAALAAAPFAAHAAQLRAVGALARDASPDAALTRLGAEIMANAAEINRLGDVEDALPWPERKGFMEKNIRPLVNESWELRARLAQMRATTLDGFRAKARVVQEYSNCQAEYADPDQDDAMAWSLANDLLGVPSVWRPEGDAGDQA